MITKPFLFLQTWQEWCAAISGAIAATWVLLKMVPKILKVARQCYARLEAAATISETLERIERCAREGQQRTEDGLCNIIDAKRLMMDVDGIHIFVEKDPKGHFVWANSRWHQITGLTHSEARGNGWENAIAPEDRPRVLSEWLQSLDHERAFDTTVTYIDRAGQRTRMRVITKPIRNGGNIIIGWRGVGTLIDL